MTTDTIGGVWTYSMDLIRGLEKYNAQIMLATFGDPLSDSQLSEVRRLPQVTLHTSTYKLEWMNDPWNDLRKAQHWILQLAFSFQPDIIHFNSYAFDGGLFNAPVVMTGHSCVLSWWQAVKNEPAPPEWRTYASVVKKGLQSADMVVAPSYAMMANLIRYYKPGPVMKVIYNAGDSAFFCPGPKEKIIFAMGRLWDEAKNIQLLLKATEYLDYPVFIAGEGHNKLAKEIVAPNVHFLGKLRRQEVAAWLSKAAIYVLPTLYEPFGLSALEAAYAGCALVLGRITSLQEIWRGDALYCDPHDPRSLSNQINQLMEDGDLLQKYAHMALNRSKNYQLSTMAAEYYRTYIALIERSKPWIKNEMMYEL